MKVCFSYVKNLKDKDTQITQYFPPVFADQFSLPAETLTEPNEVRFKTRIRYSQLGLELQKRHPFQSIWTKVAVPSLPPVTLTIYLPQLPVLLHKSADPYPPQVLLQLQKKVIQTPRLMIMTLRLFTVFLSTMKSPISMYNSHLSSKV